MDVAGDFGHGVDRIRRLLLNGRNNPGDLLRRLLGPFGQLPDLVGNNGEASARVTGPGGFDGGVQGEEVGLIGNLVDDAENLTDLFGVGAQRLDPFRPFLDIRGDDAHLGDDRPNHLPSSLGLTLGGFGHVLHVPGGPGHLFDGTADLLGGAHNGGDLVVQILGAGRDLACSVHELICGLLKGLVGTLQVADEAAKVFQKGVKDLGQAADLVTALDIDGLGEIPLPFGDVHDPLFQKF